MTKRIQDLHSRVVKLTSILDVAKAMTVERDLDTLLVTILDEVGKVVDADRCSLFLIDRARGQVWTKIAHGMEAGQEIRLPLGSGIAGYVARTGQILNVADAYADPRFHKDTDRTTGYRTRTLLCVPMKNTHNEVVGVIQALNKSAGTFSAEDEEILGALAGQAGSALENAFLYEEIQRLFDGFVRAAVVAIESRDPTTAGHSERVADLTLGLMDAVELGARGPWAGRAFDLEQRKEVRYAALLHDFGKVGIREHALTKANKLYPWELEQLEHRIAYAKKSLEAESLTRRIDLLRRGAPSMAQEEEITRYQEHARALDASIELVRMCNRPAVLPRGGFERLSEIQRLSFPGPDGTARPLLTDLEVARLSIPRGSLSRDELREIRGHVSHTLRFLSQIPWTRGLTRVPEIAGSHHEKLDGSGYPQGLRADQIGIEARMMTIADIYDALTAADRPYKKAVPHLNALQILKDEVDKGQLDSELFRLFVDAEVPRAIFGNDALMRGSVSWPLK